VTGRVLKCLSGLAAKKRLLEGRNSLTLMTFLLLLLLLLLPFVLGPVACFPSELIWNYVSYRQLVSLLG
jgi:hypothetical protein